MIIKKSMFKPHKKWAGKWPFNVDEVAVMMIKSEGMALEPRLYAIVHNYKVYALSGALESHFEKLVCSGIWACEDSGRIVPTTLMSLTPFFEFCEWQSGRLG